jgi:glutathione S-transferase
MTTVFWARAFGHFDLRAEDWPNVKRWIEALEAREAVQRTLAVKFGTT